VSGEKAECRWLRLHVFVLGAAWVATGASAWSQEKWDCPHAAAAASPIAATADSIAEGHRLAVDSCAECHGDSGRGDGPAAAGLQPRPASWRSREFQTQSDACIFWTLSNGRGAMPSAKAMPETDRWHLVNFLRSLAPD
jgi:mono/diheme cytochrome c family protein